MIIIILLKKNHDLWNEDIKTFEKQKIKSMHEEVASSGPATCFGVFIYIFIYIYIYIK